MASTSGIQHIVVLMLENRSFDHMLGYLKAQDSNIEGLTGTEANPTDPSLLDQGNVEEVTVSQLSGNAGYVTTLDPAHEYPDVTVQVFGQTPPPSPPTPENDGFVLSYSNVPDANGIPVGMAIGRTIMQCFESVKQLPVLSKLAQAFVLCDHWFASVPGPTWPNRFFVHAATSGGHTDSPTSLASVKDEMGFSTYGMRTIYENLSDQQQSWNIYYHDFPQSLALTNLHSHMDRFKTFDSFRTDVDNGTLPAYSFIEPRYFNSIDQKANDQHPPHDVQEGEKLIASVYTVLQSNWSLWCQTLLVVLYDEHGGYYDHVPPPSAVNPDGQVSTDQPPFQFDRLGVRVPAILISPLVPKGVVDHTVYDHTSLLATVKKLFQLPRFLTKRDALAATFERHFSSGTVRLQSDMPDLSAWATGASQAMHGSPVAAAPLAPEPLSSFQKSLVELSQQLNLPAGFRTELEAGTHVTQQLAMFSKS